MRWGRACAAIMATLTLTAACVRTPEVNTRPHTGTGTASAVDGVQQIVIKSGTDLRFHPSTIVVHPGLVRLVLDNTSNPGPPHDITFSGLPFADVPTTQPGEAQSVTFTAPAPGTYNFVCSIHANQGQTGKLIVK
ncbi:MAG TPA: cupredoxin domain-containing protein [Jatrophihabitans sp.]|nr:cupredoxin domain-containing protein [Jatrophihabitans sp.]